MKNIKMLRPSTSLIVAVIALVVALGGTAFASGYIITRTSQIKPSVRRALHGARGPRGARGPQGAPGQGAPGPQGPAGVAQIQVMNAPSTSMGDSSIGDSLASCPPGSVVTGGGWTSDNGGPLSATVVDNTDYSGTAWGVIMDDNGSGITSVWHAFAVCASGPGLRAALRSHVAGHSAERAFQDAIRRAAGAR